MISLYGLISFTLIIGGILSWAYRQKEKTWITPCFFFTLGWLFALISAARISDWGLLPEATQFGNKLVFMALVWSYIGFWLAFLIVPKNHKNEKENRVNEKNEYSFVRFIRRISGFLLLFQFVLGLYLLGSQISKGGVAVLSNIYLMRQLFLDQNHLLTDVWPLENRIYNILTLAATLGPAVIAYTDAKKRRVSLTILFVIYLAGAPGGISSGGRIWLALPGSVYVLTYLFSINSAQSWVIFKKVIRKLFLVVGIVLMLFSVLGSRRESQGRISVGGESVFSVLVSKPDGIFVPIYYYAAAPYVAIGPYTEITSIDGLGLGKYSFPFIWQQLTRFSDSASNYYFDWVRHSRDYIERADWRIGSTHSSIITPFVADFGLSFFAPVLGLYFFILTLSWHKMREMGFVGIIINVQIIMTGCFFSAQEAAFGTSTGILPILSILIFKLSHQFMLLQKLRRNI